MEKMGTNIAKRFYIFGYMVLISLARVSGYAISRENYHIAAQQLLESIDFSVDPCQDFYQFACGKWTEKNPLPPSKSRWTQFDILREELLHFIKDVLQQEIHESDPKPVNSARYMYAACMNTTAIEAIGLKPLTDFLAEFGGWPMASDSWDESKFDWKVATSSTRGVYGITYLLNVYNGHDSRHTDQSRIYIDQGSLTLPRTTLIKSEKYPKTMAAYAAYATGTAKLVRDSLHSHVTDDQIEAQVREMIHFESELANITTPTEKRDNNDETRRSMSLRQIQELTDSQRTSTEKAKINWYEYLNRIYSVAGIHIPQSERIIALEPEYLKKLVELLDKTPARVLANYIHWRFVRLLTPSTTRGMNSLSANFSKAVYGSSQSEPRSTSCAGDINSFLGFAVSAKYIEKTFDDSAKREVKDMIYNIKLAFKEMLSSSTWMDATTKLMALEKVDAMSEFIAYPEWIKNSSALEYNYNELASMSENEHFQNIKKINSWLTKGRLRSLRLKTDRTRWTTFPTVVNAFYTPTLNAITFPAGILHPPFYGSKGRLAAMNYGAIGSIIGHEITHGFDNKGRRSDKNGNNVQWWSAETLDNYLTRAQCFVDVYSNFSIPSGEKLNGITTQNENIADNGGLRMAFKAYKAYKAQHGDEPLLPGLEQFTNEQIFFLSYAHVYCGTDTPERLSSQILNDPHSPSRFRVLGPLPNMEDFVHVFKCAEGTPMNRLNKCALWSNN